MFNVRGPGALGVFAERCGLPAMGGGNLEPAGRRPHPASCPRPGPPPIRARPPGPDGAAWPFASCLSLSTAVPRLLRVVAPAGASFLFTAKRYPLL